MSCIATQTHSILICILHLPTSVTVARKFLKDVRYINEHDYVSTTSFDFSAVFTNHEGNIHILN